LLRRLRSSQPSSHGCRGGPLLALLPRPSVPHKRLSGPPRLMTSSATRRAPQGSSCGLVQALAAGDQSSWCCLGQSTSQESRSRSADESGKTKRELHSMRLAGSALVTWSPLPKRLAAWIPVISTTSRCRRRKTSGFGSLARRTMVKSGSCQFGFRPARQTALGASGPNSEPPRSAAWLPPEPDFRSTRHWRRQPTRTAPPRGCQHHAQWQPSQTLIAATGGADRRSAKNAAAPHGSIARSAPLGPAAPLPRGGPEPLGT
jgi:hypothetical protein